MKSTRMKPLDAVWLMMESADTPMHVGVLAIFQKPKNSPENYLSQWAEQMRDSREMVAPWNYRLSRKRGASISPRLVEEQDTDLDYHFGIPLYRNRAVSGNWVLSCLACTATHWTGRAPCGSSI